MKGVLFVSLIGKAANSVCYKKYIMLNTPTINNKSVAVGFWCAELDIWLAWSFDHATKAEHKIVYVAPPPTHANKG